MSLKFKSEISIGTIFQIVTLLVTLISFGVRIETKANTLIGEARATEEKTDRIEKYLSMKDSHYWETAKKLADSAREISQ
jgi:hypothetical protein